MEKLHVIQIQVSITKGTWTFKYVAQHFCYARGYASVLLPAAPVLLLLLSLLLSVPNRSDPSCAFTPHGPSPLRYLYVSILFLMPLCLPQILPPLLYQAFLLKGPYHG